MAMDGLRHRDHPGDGSLPDGSLVGRICQACVRTLPITGAAVSVMTPGGHRGVVFATDDTARRLEDAQFTVGQGPGVDAFRDAHASLIADLAEDAGRWPVFSTAVADLGVVAVFAFPLHLGAATLGVLTLYRDAPGPLDGPDLARAVRLGDAAAFALLDLLGGITAGHSVEVDGNGNGNGADSNGVAGGGGVGAEFFRAEVYQAAGMVMGQLGVSIETAMVRLRAYAFSTGRPTGDVARDIVARNLRFEADNG